MHDVFTSACSGEKRRDADPSPTAALRIRCSPYPENKECCRQPGEERPLRTWRDDRHANTTKFIPDGWLYRYCGIRMRLAPIWDARRP
jgi:hypothetical protein